MSDRSRLRLAVLQLLVLSLVGTLTKYLSLAYLLPIAIAVIYSESVRPWLLSIAIAAGFGFAGRTFWRFGCSWKKGDQKNCASAIGVQASIAAASTHTPKPSAGALVFMGI